MWIFKWWWKETMLFDLLPWSGIELERVKTGTKKPWVPASVLTQGTDKWKTTLFGCQQADHGYEVCPTRYCLFSCWVTDNCFRLGQTAMWCHDQMKHPTEPRLHRDLNADLEVHNEAHYQLYYSCTVWAAAISGFFSPGMWSVLCIFWLMTLLVWH